MVPFKPDNAFVKNQQQQEQQQKEKNMKLWLV
jgi:hypothetical protein